MLRDKLGAELVESVDPKYRGRSGHPEHEIHVPGCVRRDPAAQRAGIFLAEDRATASSNSPCRAGT